MSIKPNDISEPNFDMTSSGNDFRHPKELGRLPSCVADKGKVRLGGQGPVFRAADVDDKGKVRLGGQGPLFR